MNQKSPIRLEKKDHVATVILDRPEKLNTMTQAFFQGVKDAFVDVDQDPEVRVAVLRAEGKAFTAGLDLGEAGSMLSGTGAHERETLRHHILWLQDCFTQVERCRKPVIAAVNGACIGGGVDLITACDIRLASREAVFSVRESRIAIIADLGTLQRLPGLVGQGMARDLCLTGRDFTAQEAHDMGLLTRLAEDPADLMAKAMELAKEMAGMAPLTLQGVKDVLNYTRDNGVGAGLSYVAQKNAAAIFSEDLMEAFQAFMEKRKPQFKGR